MMEPLDVGFGIVIAPRDLEITYSRSSGPGGQNVNKVESRATVRFDFRNATSLPDWARALLLEKLATRLTKEGVLIVSSDRHRDQPQNLSAACRRLTELLHAALTPAQPRHATKPTRASQVRRIQAKKRRSIHKRSRQTEKDWDE